jgi:hypothetical protein
MANEITEEELRSFREQGVVIFDRLKLHINIIGKDQKGNTVVRYNEEIIATEMSSGVRVNNIIQKLRIQHPQVDKWEYCVFNDLQCKIGPNHAAVE